MPKTDYTGSYALQVADRAWVLVQLNGTTPIPRQSKVYRTENEALTAGIEQERVDREIAARQAEFAERARAAKKGR